MLFRPPKHRQLWDSWLFPHEGRYHLFYLETICRPNDHIGHAVSADLIHWTERESIPVHGAPGSWNDRFTLTGMVVAHEGKFKMLLGGYEPGIPGNTLEVIGMYLSDDLDHWHEYEHNPFLRPQAPYEAEGVFQRGEYHRDWRDLFIRQDGATGLFHGYLATQSSHVNGQSLGAKVAHVSSWDLIHWDMLPPLVETDRFFNMEVPEVFEINGTEYVTFSTNTLAGLRLNTPARKNLRGTFYMMREPEDRAFRLPEEYLLIGAGNNRQDSYVGRSIMVGDERICYGQIGNPEYVRPAWGTPKKIVRDEQSHLLHLEYWPGLDSLQDGSRRQLPCSISPSMLQNQTGQWQVSGDVYQGENLVGGTSLDLLSEESDVKIEVEVAFRSPGQLGILLRKQRYSALSVNLDAENHLLSVGMSEVPSCYDHAFEFLGWQTEISDQCAFDFEMSRTYHLTVLSLGEFLECYVDGRWFFSMAVPQAAERGAMALYVERCQASFGNLKVTGLKNQMN